MARSVQPAMTVKNTEFEFLKCHQRCQFWVNMNAQFVRQDLAGRYRNMSAILVLLCSLAKQMLVKRREIYTRCTLLHLNVNA